MVERGGLLITRALDNVQRKTIKPLICGHIIQNTVINTDEYSIYNKVAQWGYTHKTVCHSDGEYARDDDGDGINEVHVNTQEGIWSVLRSWIRPHRGIAMKNLPTYIGFFEFVFNTRKRGKALISELMKTILQPDLRQISSLGLSPDSTYERSWMWFMYSYYMIGKLINVGFFCFFQYLRQLRIQFLAQYRFRHGTYLLVYNFTVFKYQQGWD